MLGTATSDIELLRDERDALARSLAEYEVQLAQRNTELALRDAEIARLRADIEKFRVELMLLKKKQFGRASEASELLAQQLSLWEMRLAELELPATRARKESSAAAAPRKPVRMVIPDDLPVEITEIAPPASDIEGKQRIGEEVTRTLGYHPGRFFERRIVRPKYVKPNNPDAGVLIAPLPPRVIDAGLADESLLAHVVVAKFDDHLPLTRQREIYRRGGVDLAVSTMSEWMLKLGVALKPLWGRMRELLLARPALHVDETVLPMQAPGATQKARMWTYLASDADGESPLILYDFSRDKAGAHVRAFLHGWNGWLHADAASNYDELYRQNPGIAEVGCWAHARRKFFAIAEAAGKQRVLAHDAVDQINALFALEREAAEQRLDAAARQTLRMARAGPLLEALHTWCHQHLPTLQPKSPTAGAIAYVVKHWRALTRYLEDGRLKLDNNAAERALRLVAIGRKNYLFVGSERSGDATAVHLSLIETAKANGLEPLAWLTDVLRRLPTTLDKHLDTLLPLHTHYERR